MTMDIEEELGIDEDTHPAEREGKMLIKAIELKQEAQEHPEDSRKREELEEKVEELLDEM